MTRSVRRSRAHGLSLLELQVAFVVFGIALSGVAPLVIMHLRQLRTLENRMKTDTTYFLAPSSDPWSRKLGAAATISSVEPAPAEEISPDTPALALQILSVDQSPTGEDVTVRVQTTSTPP
jgi:hypothetical protein